MSDIERERDERGHHKVFASGRAVPQAQGGRTMTMVEVTVGVGAWSFTARKAFAVVPCIGDDISADGDASYTVTHRTVCPQIVYIQCTEHFTSEDEAKEAGRAWGSR